MFSLANRFSYAVALLLLAQTSLACRCAGPTDVITTDFMHQADAVTRVYVNYGITPASGAPDGYLYYVVTAYKWFKGGIGEGKLMLKTSAHSSTCGASVNVRAFNILFGSVSYEEVPGYAGTVPTLTIESCKPQKLASDLSKEEWNTLFNYKNHVVCKATDCDALTKPALDPITCPAGTDYKEAAVCKGQDNGSCGWSLSATCEKSSTPVVCAATDCSGMDKPALDPITCPKGTEFSQSYSCEAQASNTCGWTGTGSCKPVDSTNDVLQCVAKDCGDKPSVDPIDCPSGTDYSVNAICEPQASNTCGWTVSQGCAVVHSDTCTIDDCSDRAKPVLDDLSCPKGTKYEESFTCEKQTGGSCGWSGIAECKKTDDVVDCVEADCEGIAKPQIDPLPCAKGYTFVQAASCAMQSVGTCGWNVGGQCQPN